jgi:putative flippase GtrA
MRGRIYRFLMVGGFTFVIYFSLQYVFMRAGLGPLVALSGAYAIAITFHFISNALYTFKTGFIDSLTPARLIQYAGVNFGNYVINLVCGKVALMLDLPVQAGMVTGVVIATLSGFFFYDKYVFRRDDK